MARRISNAKNGMYLSVLIVGFLSCITAIIFAYCYHGDSDAAKKAMYFIFGMIIPILACVCVFFPQIEVYSGKTYTAFSHVNLALFIALVILTVTTMFVARQF